jgi:APA family basic amino acid/polyamine antiporter
MEKIVPREKLVFRVPYSPYLPVASALASLYLALNLPRVTWIRLVVWLALGIIIYLGYGYSHSKLNTTPGVPWYKIRPAFKPRLPK